MDKELFKEFEKYVKTEYGFTIKVVESDTPDSFEKIFFTREKTQTAQERC